MKVIQGPLPGFSGKNWRVRMQLMLDPFFPAWGLVPRSAAKSEEKKVPELDYSLHCSRTCQLFSNVNIVRLRNGSRKRVHGAISRYGPLSSA